MWGRLIHLVVELWDYYCEEKEEGVNSESRKYRREKKKNFIKE